MPVTLGASSNNFTTATRRGVVDRLQDITRVRSKTELLQNTAQSKNETCVKHTKKNLPHTHINNKNVVRDVILKGDIAYRLIDDDKHRVNRVSLNGAAFDKRIITAMKPKDINADRWNTLKKRRLREKLYSGIIVTGGVMDNVSSVTHTTAMSYYIIPRGKYAIRNYERDIAATSIMYAKLSDASRNNYGRTSSSTNSKLGLMAATGGKRFMGSKNVRGIKTNLEKIAHLYADMQCGYGNNTNVVHAGPLQSMFSIANACKLAEGYINLSASIKKNASVFDEATIDAVADQLQDLKDSSAADGGTTAIRRRALVRRRDGSQYASSDRFVMAGETDHDPTITDDSSFLGGDQDALKQRGGASFRTGIYSHWTKIWDAYLKGGYNFAWGHPYMLGEGDPTHPLNKSEFYGYGVYKTTPAQYYENYRRCVFSYISGVQANFHLKRVGVAATNCAGGGNLGTVITDIN